MAGKGATAHNNRRQNMTEIERYETPPQPEFPLSKWADEFLDTARVSSELARTRFVPESLWVFRKRDGQEVFDAQATTAQVTAAIVTGRELGMSPMASLRSIDVIQGQPALRAVALRALLLSHGHDIWVEEATNHRATVSGRRANSDRIQSITWTMDDAKQRNLDGKPNWRKQPRNMLIARATGDVARMVAADVLLGVPYLVEELEDGVDSTNAIGASSGDGAPRAPARRTRRPRAAAGIPAAAPGTDTPPLDEQPAAAEATQPEPADEPTLDEPAEQQPGMTEPQQRRMHALIRQRFGDYRNTTVRETVLTHLSETVGRPIDTTGELTFDEASAVIRDLEPEPSFDDEPTPDEHEA
jgi:hypothetical protein